MSRAPMASRSVLAVLCASAVLLAPPLALAADGGGGETPEAVYARVVAAAENEDVGETFACLAPEERAQTTLMMVVMTGFMVGMAGMATEMGGELGEAFVDDGSEEAKAALAKQQAEAGAKAAAMTERWEAILAKHGLEEMLEGPEPEDGASAAKALEGIDQAALVNELVAFLEEFGDEEATDGDAGPFTAPVGELEDLVVEGDAATAHVGEEEVRFVRVDGRWYLTTGGLDELE